MLSLTQRSYDFGGNELVVACRCSPQEMARCTLTLQNDKETKQGDTPRGDLIGLDLWPASISLCQYLAAYPHVVAGQAVLELGAGMGLPGLLAAKLGASSVLLTDYEPLVLEQLRSNVELNGASACCAVHRLDWLQAAEAPAAAGELPPGLLGSRRLLLAADVLYAQVIVKPFVGTLLALLHPQDGVLLLAHQVRRAITLDPHTRLPKLEDSDEPFEAFLAACRQAGLHLHTVSTRETCSNVDTDPMNLVAVAKSQIALQRLPAWDHCSSLSGGSGGGSKSSGGAA